MGELFKRVKHFSLCLIHIVDIQWKVIDSIEHRVKHHHTSLPKGCLLKEKEKGNLVFIQQHL